MTLGSDILKTANVPIIQYERCVNIYSRYQMDKNFICAGPPNGSASCCKVSEIFIIFNAQYFSIMKYKINILRVILEDHCLLKIQINMKLLE